MAQKVTKGQLILENAAIIEERDALSEELSAAIFSRDDANRRVNVANIKCAEKENEIDQLEAKLALVRLAERSAVEEGEGISDTLSTVIGQAEFLVRGLSAITSYRGPDLNTPRRLANILLDAVTDGDDEEETDVPS